MLDFASVFCENMLESFENLCFPLIQKNVQTTRLCHGACPHSSNCVNIF